MTFVALECGAVLRNDMRRCKSLKRTLEAAERLGTAARRRYEQKDTTGDGRADWAKRR